MLYLPKTRCRTTHSHRTNMKVDAQCSSLRESWCAIAESSLCHVNLFFSICKSQKDSSYMFWQKALFHATQDPYVEKKVKMFCYCRQETLQRKLHRLSSVAIYNLPKSEVVSFGRLILNFCYTVSIPFCFADSQAPFSLGITRVSFTYLIVHSVDATRRTRSAKHQ